MNLDQNDPIGSLDEFQWAASAGHVTPEASKARMLLYYALGLNGHSADVVDLLMMFDPSLASIASESQKAAQRFAAAVKTTVFTRTKDHEKVRRDLKLQLGQMLRLIAATAQCMDEKLSDLANLALRHQVDEFKRRQATPKPKDDEDVQQ